MPPLPIRSRLSQSDLQVWPIGGSRAVVAHGTAWELTRVVHVRLVGAGFGAEGETWRYRRARSQAVYVALVWDALYCYYDGAIIASCPNGKYHNPLLDT